MRLLVITGAVCFFPLSALASTLLANCDSVPHDVIVRNGGAERVVTLSRLGGEIEEFGPSVSFQIKDSTKKQPVVVPGSPDEEFCIWSGRIGVQRLNTSGAYRGGWR